MKKLVLARLKMFPTNNPLTNYIYIYIYIYIERERGDLTLNNLQ